MLKATATILSGWMALVLSLPTGSALAGSGGGEFALLVGAMSVGQTDTAVSAAGDPRQQTADLLIRARRAMAENDLNAADALISQAEALKVDFSPLTMSDTPRKARQALERMRQAAGNVPARPSQMFSPLGSGQAKAPPTDPFIGRTAGGADRVLPPGGPLGSAPAMPLPPTDSAAAIHSANAANFSNSQPYYAQAPSVAPPTGDDLHLPPALARQYQQPAAAAGPAPMGGDRVQSDNLLRLARTALAVGDVRRATELLNQAKRLQVRYAPLEDSPERVEAAVNKYQDTMSLDKNTEAYRRAYARMLMEQAEALFRYGELGLAEELGDRALRQQAAFGPFEARPQELLGASLRPAVKATS